MSDHRTTEFVGRYVRIPFLDASGVWRIHEHDIREGVARESCPVIWSKFKPVTHWNLDMPRNMPRNHEETSDA